MELIGKIRKKICTFSITDKFFLSVMMILLFLGIVLFIPFVRELIILITQKIIHRKLRDYGKWMYIILNVGIFFVKIALCCFLAFFILRDTKKNYPKFFCISILMCFLYTISLIIKNRCLFGEYNNWDFADLLLQIDRLGYFAEFYGSEYPPIAICIYKLFHLFWPIQVENLTVILNYILTMFIISITLSLFVIIYISLKGSTKFKFFLSLSFFCSGPILYTYCRANIIFYALILTMVFIKFYDSENKIYKELALISLAVAANIKLYPAVYGCILLKKKRWKDALKCFCYGLGLFIAPSFFTQKTLFENITAFFKGLSTFTESVFLQDNLSLKTNIFKLVEKTSFISIGKERIMILLGLLIIVIFCICFLFSLLAKKEYQTYLMLTYMCLFIPTPAFYYNMIFMIIPFISFINTYEGILIEKITGIFFIFIFLFDFVHFKCYPNAVWHIYTLFLLTLVFIIIDIKKRRLSKLQILENNLEDNILEDIKNI